MISIFRHVRLCGDCVVNCNTTMSTETNLSVALLQFYFTETVLKKKHFMDVPKPVDDLIYLLNNAE